MVNKILTTTLMTVNSHVNVQIVAVIIRYTQDLVRVGRKEKEVLTVKHLNNIPDYEARKLVVGS